MKVYGLKNVFGKIRIDTRWSLYDCVKRLRKSESVEEFEIDQVTAAKHKSMGRKASKVSSNA